MALTVRPGFTFVRQDQWSESVKSSRPAVRLKADPKKIQDWLEQHSQTGYGIGRGVSCRSQSKIAPAEYYR